jgi:3-oxoacyl-(acyl-carrier-protein) synthase
MFEPILKARELVSTAAATITIGQVLKLIVGGAKRHVSGTDSFEGFENDPQLSQRR